jgi:hypothetical protein
MQICAKCGTDIDEAHNFCMTCGIAVDKLVDERDAVVPKSEEAKRILKEIRETEKTLESLQLRYQSVLDAENAAIAADNEKKQLLAEELELEARLKDIRIEKQGYSSGDFDDQRDVSDLEDLRNSHTVRERIALARSEQEASTLQRLTFDEVTAVREAVAANSNAAKILAMFLKDPDNSVRVEAATNRYCPPSVLASFSEDLNYRVRLAVAENSNTPIETLRRLSVDANTKVERSASKRL